MRHNTVPVIDIGELTRAETLAALDVACREWGFFQVVNHGIEDRLVAGLFDQVHAFFAQPLATKRAISRTRENPWGFYDRELTKNVRDRKQVFDFGPADGCRLQPQWPDGMAEFRNAVEAYYRHCEDLAFRLLAAISTNLGMSPGYLSRAFGPRHTSFLRLNYYPVLPITDAPEFGAFGVGQHTDAGALTLLLQDDQPGLEVRKDDRWFLIEPRRDALVVNIGDIVQVWSNDRYRAALHRVVASTGGARFSIPFFLSPEYRTNYAPLPATVSAARPARYRPINWGEFHARRVAGDYADEGTEVQISQYRIAS